SGTPPRSGGSPPGNVSPPRLPPPGEAHAPAAGQGGRDRQVRDRPGDGPEVAAADDPAERAEVPRLRGPPRPPGAAGSALDGALFLSGRAVFVPFSRGP